MQKMVFFYVRGKKEFKGSEMWLLCTKMHYPKEGSEIESLFYRFIGTIYSKIFLSHMVDGKVMFKGILLMVFV